MGSIPHFPAGGSRRLLSAGMANNHVRVVVFDTSVVSTLAGSGAAASTGDGGDVRAASIMAPRAAGNRQRQRVFGREWCLPAAPLCRQRHHYHYCGFSHARPLRRRLASQSKASQLNGARQLAVNPDGATLYIADTDLLCGRSLLPRADWPCSQGSASMGGRLMVCKRHKAPSRVLVRAVWSGS